VELQSKFENVKEHADVMDISTRVCNNFFFTPVKCCGSLGNADPWPVLTMTSLYANAFQVARTDPVGFVFAAKKTKQN
jgi:hypothetical protein